MYNYDLNIPLVQYKTKKYTIDECFDIILDVVKIFGEDYVNIIKKAKEERWIDYYPHSGKRLSLIHIYATKDKDYKHNQKKDGNVTIEIFEILQTSSLYP